MEHGSGWEVTWPRDVPGLLGMLVDTSRISLAKGRDLAPQSHAGRTLLCCWRTAYCSAQGRVRCLRSAPWVCLPREAASPRKWNSFFAVKNNPPSHWGAKSPLVLKHKPSYQINASLHLCFQPGLILELGKRLIMDSVGQK